MTSLARPALALWYGAFMLCVETCDHFEVLARFPKGWPDLPLYDWFAAIALVVVGVKGGRNWLVWRAYQIAAWAFMLSLLAGSFYGHVGEWLAGAPSDHLLPQGPVLVILIGLIGIAACALFSTIRAESSDTNIRNARGNGVS